MLDWLKRLFGQKKEPEKSRSHHTMGPEELITPEEDAEMETESPPETTTMQEGNWEEVKPVETVHKQISMGQEQPLNHKESLRVMEAALFMASRGMNVEELGKISGVPLLKVREYLPQLVDEFNARPSALEIVEDVGGYHMKVRSPYDEKVSHLAGSGELSPGEMKTLAFIAYKQPLIQSQLVQVRSNSAYDHLQVLVDKGFVSREPKGRTYILRTTKKFAEYFGTHALKLRPMKEEEKTDHSQAEELS